MGSSESNIEHFVGLVHLISQLFSVSWLSPSSPPSSADIKWNLAAAIIERVKNEKKKGDHEATTNQSWALTALANNSIAHLLITPNAMIILLRSRICADIINHTASTTTSTKAKKKKLKTISIYTRCAHKNVLKCTRSYRNGMEGSEANWRDV